MLKLGEGETDANEKPRYPHKIVKAKVSMFNVFSELQFHFLVLHLSMHIFVLHRIYYQLCTIPFKPM